MRTTRWTYSELKDAVRASQSLRQVIFRLKLIPAGGNYEHVKRIIGEMNLDTSHFTGKLWNKGKIIPREPLIALKDILIKESGFQSYKLKNRLFKEGLKKPICEICGWCKKSPDGRTPLELDHMNGNRHDNRIENLRILCPNCHSLQPTHRGRNIRRRGGVIGSRV